MSTVIRSELSPKNKYWIDKHRYYELKHFCLQYNTWKREYLAADDYILRSKSIEYERKNTDPVDLVSECAIRKAEYSNKMELLKSIAIKSDPYLWTYILRAVTEQLSYEYLKTNLSIPCGKDMYYDRYRRFFWLLDKTRK